MASSGWSGTGLLVVISAPSGGGKTTVIGALRRRHPEFLYSISVTTRPKRSGERDGRHYYFRADEEFQRMKQAGEMLEWAQVHGHFYGTPRFNVERAFQRRRVMLFDIDVQGAASIRTAISNVVSIFLLPPSWATLVRRLTGRHSEDGAMVQARLRTAREELARAGEYEYLVTNDALKTCVADCESIIRAELLRRERHQGPAGTPAPAKR